MSKELDAKLKTALDESRLLILGAQVLLGIAFQAASQNLFSEIGGQVAFYTSLRFAFVGKRCSPGCAFIYHQIACDGHSLRRAVHVATSFSNWSLLLLTIGALELPAMSSLHA